MENLGDNLVEGSFVFLFCVCLFLLVYAIGVYGLFSGWKTETRLEAASCCMSMIHGSVATMLSGYVVMRSLWKWDAPNTVFQNKVMEFSTAYFLVDLIHYVLFAPKEFHFILHHVATITYIFSCRYYTKHGAMSVMALLGLGEMTAPFQNVWSITRMATTHSPLARRIYHSISPFFTLYFTFTRAVVAPCLAWKLCKYYLTGQADAVIPRWLVSYWMSTVILAIIGSIIWARKLWEEFFRVYIRINTADPALSKAQ